MLKNFEYCNFENVALEWYLFKSLMPITEQKHIVANNYITTMLLLREVFLCIFIKVYEPQCVVY